MYAYTIASNSRRAERILECAGCSNHRLIFIIVIKISPVGFKDFEITNSVCSVLCPNTSTGLQLGTMLWTRELPIFPSI